MSSRETLRPRQIARRTMWTVLCAQALLVLGGMWWLLDRQSPALGVDTVRPLMVTTPAPAEPKPALVPTATTPTPLEPASAPAPTESVPPAIGMQPVEATVSAPAAPPASITRPARPGPTFDGRLIQPVRTIRMIVTAYSPDARSCGKFADNITASGYSVWTNGMKLVAADTDLLPFGSILTIPGYNDGRPVPVLDRGGAIKGKRLDVLYPTHETALKWGVQTLDVTVWEYAD